VLVYHAHGVDVFHLYSGRRLSTIPLEGHGHALYVDVNGDGLVDSFSMLVVVLMVYCCLFVCAIVIHFGSQEFIHPVSTILKRDAFTAISTTITTTTTTTITFHVKQHRV
jgi:hypothetical protein